MPFSHRAFCRDFTAPSLSEALVWLRQRGFPAKIRGGQGGGGDLLSSFWQEAEISIDGDDNEAPLRLGCLRADAVGLDRLATEVADFAADVRELPPSAARTSVLDQLAATRLLLIIEFPHGGHSSSIEGAAESLTQLFVEKAAGLTQRDGVGFLDEDDDVVLPIA